MPYLGGRRPKKRKFSSNLCDEGLENESANPPADDKVSENMSANVTRDYANEREVQPGMNCLTDSRDNNIPTDCDNSAPTIPGSQSTGDGLHKKNGQKSVNSRDEISGFRYVDVNLLVSFIAKFPCPSCGKAHLGYSDPRQIGVKEETVGQATTLQFTCGTCESNMLFTNSAKAGPNFEVNSRFPAAMFSIGNDYDKAKQLCAKMKMPKPLQFKSWMNKPHSPCPRSMSDVTQESVTKH